MSQLTFEVMTMNGQQLEVTVEATDTVRNIKEAAEKQLELQEHTFLKLVCDGDVLLNSMKACDLKSKMIFASVSREQDLEVLKQAASSYAGYADVLASSAVTTDGTQNIGTTKEFPSILDVLEDLSGQRKDVPDMKAEESGKLRFWGRTVGLLQPALRAGPLKKLMGTDALDEICITVACNSDEYNRGLGVVLEASPLMCSTVDEKGIPSYMYNGYGLSDREGGYSSDEDDEEKPAAKRRNAVKFHPGMHGGQLRIEGVGGFGNSDVRFNPGSLTQTNGALHTLKLTLRTSGRNTVEFKGVGQDGSCQDPVWSRDWNRELFDGEHIPAVYGICDLGSVESKGVIYGPLSLQARHPGARGGTGGGA